MPLTSILANDDIKNRLSKRLARLGLQDMQRGDGSADNIPEIDILRRIEIILQNPETYKVMEYPTHKIVDDLIKYAVISQEEGDTLLEKITGQPSTGRPAIRRPA